MQQSTNDQTYLLTASRLLKAIEVASYLNVSRSFAYKLLQSGAIPTIRLGKAVRVRLHDLENFINSNVNNNNINK